MVGNSGMGNADQFATLSSPCLINSYLLTVQMTAAMRAVALTTVRFLTQPIQMSSSLLGTLVINGLEELGYKTYKNKTCNMGMSKIHSFCDYHLTQHEDTLHLSV